jgi:hypothetical protein
MSRRKVNPGDDQVLPGGPVTPHDDFEIGLTGARFGGAPRKKRRSRAERAAEKAAAAPDSTGDPDPDTSTFAVVSAAPGAAEPLPPPAEPEGPTIGYTGARFVRPYVYTRGRTRSRYELGLETLVSTPAAAFERPELAEHLPVLDLCRRPTSIAEVAALVGVPIGVARVIVGDLAVTGGLVVHRTVSAEGPDVALMERVLGGLRRL